MEFTRAIKSLKPEGAFVVLAKAKELEAKGKKIIHLEIGQPDFPTPEHIVQSAKNSLDEIWTHGYTPSLGVMDLRIAIAEDLSARRGVDFCADEVIVCPGAKPALMATVLALVEPGTKLLYPDPGFPSYHSLASFVNAKGVGIPLLEKNGFSFDLDFLEKEIKGSSLLILNSPANPTGGILKKEDLEIISNLCIENNVSVLSDEVYSRMCYDGNHVSIATIPGMKERTVVIDGFSKTYAMTGWRAGYAAADRKLIEKLGLFMNNNTSCVNGMTQAACIEAIRGTQDPSEMMIQEFKERRSLIVNGLNSVPGFSCKNPGGAFYAFPNIQNTNLSGKKISDHMLEKGVALLPGEDFGRYGKGYIRLSYANSRENILQAIDMLIEEVPKISR